MTVTSILASSALTTYAAAKSRINAQGGGGAQIVDDTHQNEVERLINAVSDAVVKYCGREFRKVSRVERHAPPDGERLVLDVTPVASTPAPTATIDSVAATVEIEDANRGYLRCDAGWGGEDYKDTHAGAVTLSTKPGSAERVVLVTYTGGYVTPSDEVAASAGPPVVEAVLRTLPWDLEEAVIVAVSILWKWRLGGYANDVLPDRNTAIGRGMGGILPDVVLPMLDTYRRWDF